MRDLPKGTRVLVAMSGGVDSTVAAHRLVQAGFDVVGITMHLVPDECRPVAGAQASDDRACCSLAAAEDARRMANAIRIPHYMLNLAEQFEDTVMKPSRDEYLRGRTPNPCVLCNRYMKFDILFRRAEQLECTYVATGHYARIAQDDSGWHLSRGLDESKDQTYFLAYLTDSELEKIIFPLGNDEKSSVREEAWSVGLKVADRPESQDLCFFASGTANLTEVTEIPGGIPGDIVSTDGSVVGCHNGIAGYTVGQRKGIPGGMAEKMYVVTVDAAGNRVVIGTDDECYASEFSVEDLSLVSDLRDRRRLENPVGVQVRYRTNPVSGSVELSDNGTGTVKLEMPVRAITPGQIAVFYENDEVLGAGVISSVKIPHWT